VAGRHWFLYEVREVECLETMHLSHIRERWRRMLLDGFIENVIFKWMLVDWIVFFTRTFEAKYLHLIAKVNLATNFLYMCVHGT
jgi:hypothetical protein